MRKIFLILALTVGLMGCVTTAPTQQERQEQFQARMQAVLQQARASDEAGPLPANWQKLTEDYIRGVLRDPDSGRFDFVSAPVVQPTKGFYRPMHMRGESVFCWVASVHVNAKNAFGGYTGNKLYMVGIRDGRVIAAFEYHPARRWDMVF
jgi:hypothetical protein